MLHVILDAMHLAFSFFRHSTTLFTTHYRSMANARFRLLHMCFLDRWDYDENGWFLCTSGVVNDYQGRRRAVLRSDIGTCSSFRGSIFLLVFPLFLVFPYFRCSTSFVLDSFVYSLPNLLWTFICAGHGSPSLPTGT